MPCSECGYPIADYNKLCALCDGDRKAMQRLIQSIVDSKKNQERIKEKFIERQAKATP